MHSIEYNYCLDSFVNIWPKNAVRALSQQLRNNNDFIIPTVHREIFRRFPLYSFPHTWNSLGPVKLQHNRTTFRISLSEELLSSLTIHDP
jgi:hypothetical protein